MRKIYIPVCFLFALAFAEAGAQTTVNITADKDNTMYSESGNTSNGAGQNFFAGATASGNARRGLIHFNLSSIPSNATVTAVTITLTCNKAASSAAGIRLFKVTADWGEGTSDATANEGGGAAATANDATWTNRFHPSTAWSSAGGDFNPTASATQSSVGTGAVALSSPGLLADVQTFVTTSSVNFGWIVIGSAEGSASTALRFASSENGSTSSRPQISVTYTVVTPVTLKAFHAAMQGRQVVLNWQTASELQNDFFGIEHSADGSVFTPIGRVKGAGNSSALRNYSFIHHDAGAGAHFYRLAQHDLDGRVHYSSIVRVGGTRLAQLQVTPNPARDQVRLLGAAALDGCSYELIEANGRIVGTGILNRQISVSALPPGVYRLRIRTGEGGVMLTSTFMKN